MKRRHGVWFLLVFFGIAAGNAAFALDSSQHAVATQGTGTHGASEGTQVMVRVPLFSQRFEQVPLALVDEDPVTVGDLATALANIHEKLDAAKEQSQKIDYGKILDRLINVRLVAHEATAMGLDELDEFKAGVDAYSAQALGMLLMQDIKKDVTRADPDVVERLYKERIGECRIKSVSFEKEDDAKNMADAIKAGKNFDELAEKAVAEKKAKASSESNYIKLRDFAPDIKQAIATLQTGSIGPVLKVQAAKTPLFVIIKLEDRRYPEDPGAREQAEKDALNGKKTIAWENYKTSLFTKYVTIREKFLDKLDLDTPKNDFPKLLKDTRVVATFTGGKPITVGDLMATLEEIHFHGLEQAAESKKLNRDKQSSLFKIISRRVIERAVLEKGFAKSEEYQRGLKQYKDETLFGLFLEKMGLPDLKYSEAELIKYYEGHQKEYLYPEMMKMSSLAFKSKRQAESARNTLLKGGDLNWVKANAEGFIAESDDDPLIWKGSVLSTRSLPRPVAGVVAGAHAGDVRLYESPEGKFYVLCVQAVIPATQQPFEEVRAAIGEILFQEKMNQAMEGWFKKLRSAYTIKIYLTDMGK
jgi:hypothetical protein